MSQAKEASSVHPKLLNSGTDDDEEEDVPPSKEELLTTYVQDNISGGKVRVKGPFGRKELMPCDSSQNGRSLSFIESFLEQEVIPLLSNDSLTTSISTLQTTMYLDEAKNILFKATNAGSQDELLFFSPSVPGNESFQVFIGNLLIKTMKVSEPLLFVSEQYEDKHLAPWLEIRAEIIKIPDQEDGRIDTKVLKCLLEDHGETERQKIGLFSACSEITGVLNEDLNLTALLHHHNALCFWDYSTVAHCAAIDMNPESPEDAEGFYAKDGIFFSAHTLVGGYQTCYLLLIKKALLHSNSSDTPQQTNRDTATIVAKIKTGLVFQLKEAITSKHIMERQKEMGQIIRRKLLDSGQDTVKIVGNLTAHRITTLSFVVKNSDTGFYLHQDLICAMLQDLFGIQSRIVSALDHSYASDLFGITDKKQQYLDLAFTNGRKTLGAIIPGLVQIDIAWYFSMEQVEFILDALLLIAEEGWKLLPQYNFSTSTGEWFHINNFAFVDRRCLKNISYADGEMTWKPDELAGKSAFILGDAILKVKENTKNAKKVASSLTIPDHRKLLPKEALELRWFMLPTEAKSLLCPGVFKSKKASVKELAVTNELFIIKSFTGTTDDSVVEINPIGTLSGSAVFPKPLQGPNCQSKPRGKPFWLQRALKRPVNLIQEEYSREEMNNTEAVLQENYTTICESLADEKPDKDTACLYEGPGEGTESDIQEELKVEDNEAKTEPLKPIKKSLFSWFRRGPCAHPEIDEDGPLPRSFRRHESPQETVTEEKGQAEKMPGQTVNEAQEEKELVESESPQSQILEESNVKVSEMDDQLKMEIEQAVENCHRKSLEVIMEEEHENNSSQASEPSLTQEEGTENIPKYVYGWDQQQQQPSQIPVA